VYFRHGVLGLKYVSRAGLRAVREGVVAIPGLEAVEVVGGEIHVLGSREEDVPSDASDIYVVANADGQAEPGTDRRAAIAGESRGEWHLRVPPGVYDLAWQKNGWPSRMLRGDIEVASGERVEVLAQVPIGIKLSGLVTNWPLDGFDLGYPQVRIDQQWWSVGPNGRFQAKVWKSSIVVGDRAELIATGLSAPAGGKVVFLDWGDRELEIEVANAGLVTSIIRVQPLWAGEIDVRVSVRPLPDAAQRRYGPSSLVGQGTWLKSSKNGVVEFVRERDKIVYGVVREAFEDRAKTRWRGWFEIGPDSRDVTYEWGGRFVRLIQENQPGPTDIHLGGPSGREDDLLWVQTAGVSEAVEVWIPEQSKSVFLVSAGRTLREEIGSRTEVVVAWK